MPEMLEEILPGLFAFHPPRFGSNAYIFKGKQNCLIDTSSEQNIIAFRSALAEISVAPESVSRVFFSHEHADHFSGAKLFPKAEFFASAPCRKIINENMVEFTHAKIVGSKEKAFVQKTLSEGDTLKVNGFSLEVIATPGHALGGLSFFEKKRRLLFSGDALFEGCSGRVDLAGSDRQTMTASLEKLARLDFETLLSGHGSAFNGNQKENIESALRLLG